MSKTENIFSFVSEKAEYHMSYGQKAILNEKSVFIKTPKQEAAALAQFEKEIVFLTKAIKLENILKPVEVGSEMLIFPYIEKSLIDFVELADEDRILDSIIKPLLQILSDLHNENISHCDIKLENIRIDEKFNIFLADFGKAVDTTSLNTNTPGYLSQHHPVDITLGCQFDIFSVGVIAYQLAFGLNFLREFQLVGRTFKNLQERKEFSQKFCDFISICTDYDVSKRFKSAEHALSFLSENHDKDNTIIEEYNLSKYFEVYLNYLKETFEASQHGANRFRGFAGNCGEKYFDRLSKWSNSANHKTVHLRLGNDIIGILEASIKYKRGQISTIFINKQFRRKGYAALLENFALDFFKKSGCTEAILNVSKVNSAAIAAYERMGWSKNDNSIYEDAFSFTKQLI